MKKLLRRSRLSQHLFQLALVFSFLLLGSTYSWAIVVTSTADSGAGSLRAAITTANGDGVATTITFNLAVFPPPPALPGVIVLLSALSNLTGPGDTIDGTAAGVVLDGTNLAVDAGLRVRASNVTIQALTFQNFPGNDGVVVEGRNATPVVTGVMIIGNTFLNNFRAVRVDGGSQDNNTTVNASVIGNTLSDNKSGIAVFGNVGTGDGGNTVSAFIDSNTIKGAQIEPLVGGDGILVLGATSAGSGNNVSATVSNNVLNDIPNDGVVISGCGNDDTGSNNTVNGVVTGNVIRYKNDNSPPNFLNQGIVVTGAAGESDALSFCSGNSIVFEVSNNNVDGLKNNNIIVSGGDEGTANNDVQGIIVGNTATNSRGNPGGASRGGTGISVSGGSGTGHTVHDITVSGNTARGNPLRGIIVSGGGGDGNSVTGITVSSNTVDGKPPQSPQYSIIPEADQDGILVTGSTNAVNSVLSDILVDGNITKNNLRGGVRVSQGDASNDVSISGITDNIATGNSEDGISIRVGVPGLGATPVSGNQCNNNGQDGIDINSSGYSLSNNSCSRNVADGINAVVGNTNDGGNSGRRNGACNQPAFCFGT
jgi:parallel beta-helix repeat protein